MIGGTGIISTAVTQLLTENGHRVTLYHRSEARNDVHTICGDYGNMHETRQKLRGTAYDAVINWICYKPEQLAFDIDLFTGATGQYVLISSTVVYKRPCALPMTENSERTAGEWSYAENKLRCETLLQEQSVLPYTIVRPSHTYGKGKLPMPLAHTKRYWTLAERITKRQPVIVPGDGTSVWTLTHSSDFARGLLPLLGNAGAIGTDFHITSSEWLTWNQIVDTLAEALSEEAIKIPIPSCFIEEHLPGYKYTLTHDKAHSAIFDNSKRLLLAPDSGAVIPFSEGIRYELQHYNRNPRIVDQTYDRQMEKLLKQYRAAIVH
jgi:nucleoside-diphosphate-sugar epimerase